MRIVVVGAGAVGGYFGGRLAQAGNSVAFVARGRTLDVLRSEGLRVETPDGEFRVRPEEVTDDPAKIGPVEIVLVAVKAWQVPLVGPRLKPLCGDNSVVVPLQNGVEAPAQLVAALGEQPVLGGLCKIISVQVAPGHVRHVGVEPLVAFGEIGRSPTERVRSLRQLLESAGITVETPTDIRVALWEKFLLITALGGVGAMARGPVGEWRHDPTYRPMLKGAMEEIRAVAEAREIPMASDVLRDSLVFIDGLPATSTASMQRDLLAGRPSEFEYQTGAVVRLGREAGVPTPVNSEIYQAFSHSSRPARARGKTPVPP